MTHRGDIISEVLKTGLVEKCVAYQTHGIDPYLKEELTQEVYIFLLTYDWDKLLSVYEGNHLNACITTFIRRQYRSNSSPFWHRYRKHGDRETTLEDSEAMEMTVEPEW